MFLCRACDGAVRSSDPRVKAKRPRDVVQVVAEGGSEPLSKRARELVEQSVEVPTRTVGREADALLELVVQRVRETTCAEIRPLMLAAAAEAR